MSLVGSSSAVSQMLQGLGLDPKLWSKGGGGGKGRGSLQAWVSGQDVTITRGGGPTTTQRVDMLIGGLIG